MCGVWNSGEKSEFLRNIEYQYLTNSIRMNGIANSAKNQNSGITNIYLHLRMKEQEPENYVC